MVNSDKTDCAVVNVHLNCSQTALLSDCVVTAALFSLPEKLNAIHTLDESKVELLIVVVKSADVVQL